MHDVRTISDFQSIPHKEQIHDVDDDLVSSCRISDHDDDLLYDDDESCLDNLYNDQWNNFPDLQILHVDLQDVLHNDDHDSAHEDVPCDIHDDVLHDDDGHHDNDGDDDGSERKKQSKKRWTLVALDSLEHCQIFSSS